jgi:superfamily II DNA or RNA helicase
MSSPLLTSTFRPPRFEPSLPWRESVPVIVAESLEPVSLPLETMLRAGIGASAGDVVGNIAQNLSRIEDSRPLPGWLRPEQRAACARILPMLGRYRSALLASPVGSGKTFVALAVAAVWPGKATAVVPATIADQWERTAAGLGVSLAIWTHERLSRGSLPPSLCNGAHEGLVVVDESHHFRNPETRRYLHLAPLLAGKTVLLLSATPVVNGPQDLTAQLLLGVRDDALLPFGIPSLRQHLSNTTPVSTASGELVLTQTGAADGRPVRTPRKDGAVPLPGLESRCQRIEQLQLSSSRATAALIRTVIWRALASSDMALLGVLRRYRALLFQARDAAESGRALSRAVLRSLAGEFPEQLVMWDLLPPAEAPGDMILDDLPLLDSLIEEARDESRLTDSKCERLITLLEDGKASLVFTGARETVRYLKEQLPRAAWCTGEAAGIGHTRMAREDVLWWFRPGSHSAGGPVTLITTDVAAEGLDLQAAARVVHYDLPWTAVRLDQRDGRALRLGSHHSTVEVIRFTPPGPIDRRLGQLGAIARKRRLPRRTGVDPGGARSWTWRDDIASRYRRSTTQRHPLFCRVDGNEGGLLAGFSVYSMESTSTRRVASSLGFLDAHGSWSEQPELVSRMMDAALSAAPWPSQHRMTHSELASLSGVIRERLELIQLAQWTSHTSNLQTRIITRLNRIAARAVRGRKRDLLSLVERAIEFARRGHTAGEERWMEQWLSLPESALIDTIGLCPTADGSMPSSFCELLGVVVFMPQCPASERSSSISTVP